MRTGLQTGVDNQIEGLTTSDGLTRVEAEDQISAIGEQTYQTSLLVRDLQDAIYSRNLDIAAIKIQQRDIDDSILKVQDDIYANETNILGIQNTRLEPLQKQLTLIEEEKARILLEQQRKEQEKWEKEMEEMRKKEKVNIITLII